MMSLGKVVQGIREGLEALLEKTKEMEIAVNSIEQALTGQEQKAEPKAPRKAPAQRRPRKAAGRGSAGESVLNFIMKSDNPVTTDEIKKKTGLKERQIWGIINRSKKEGKIKMEKRGHYVKA